MYSSPFPRLPSVLTTAELTVGDIATTAPNTGGNSTTQQSATTKPSAQPSGPTFKYTVTTNGPTTRGYWNLQIDITNLPPSVKEISPLVLVSINGTPFEPDDGRIGGFSHKSPNPPFFDNSITIFPGTKTSIQLADHPGGGNRRKYGFRVYLIDTTRLSSGLPRGTVLSSYEMLFSTGLGGIIDWGVDFLSAIDLLSSGPIPNPTTLPLDWTIPQSLLKKTPTTNPSSP